MAAIYSNGGNRWNILGFNFTKRDALSIVYIGYLWEYSSNLYFVKLELKMFLVTMRDCQLSSSHANLGLKLGFHIWS